MVTEGTCSSLLGSILAGLRAEARQAVLPRQVSAAARAMGVHRHTLELWLYGNDNVSVWTLCQIAAWLVQQQASEHAKM